ncbi:hypothetical protein FB451DRAFT_1414595 [Mycena latifolia]|nr:hypothetical protein FB451DRAFT_1414595 [Mycena latifolia]
MATSRPSSFAHGAAHGAVATTPGLYHPTPSQTPRLSLQARSTPDSPPPLAKTFNILPQTPRVPLQAVTASSPVYMDFSQYGSSPNATGLVLYIARKYTGHFDCFLGTPETFNSQARRPWLGYTPAPACYGRSSTKLNVLSL